MPSPRQAFKSSFDAAAVGSGTPSFRPRSRASSRSFCCSSTSAKGSAGIRSARATPSQKPTTCTTRARLIATFISRARPFSPTLVTFGPITSRTGLMRSYAPESPPTMIASCPASRVARLPETGASSICAPVSATRSASRRLAAASIVLMSAYTFPAPSPARIPSGPDATSSTAAVSVTIERTTSAPSATSRGVPATTIPLASRDSARPGLRFQPVTGWPAASSRSTILPPIEPSPTKPTLGGKHVLVGRADTKRPQPVELAMNDRHAISELHELRLSEVTMQALPQLVVGGCRIPGDRLRPAQRGPLALVEAIGGLEIDHVVVAVEVAGAQPLQLRVHDPPLDHVRARLAVRAQHIRHPRADRIALPRGIQAAHDYRATARTAVGARPSSVPARTS